MTYQITECAPEAAEYCQLRLDAGLSAKSLEAASRGLPHSLFALCLRDEGRLVAMGRVVGDGACFFQIVDIAVHPHYQGQGLGNRVMDHIEAYLHAVALPGSYVSLIGDKPGFYEKRGYLPTAPGGIGMYKVFV